ncbi:hypothetical protein WJX73_004815 [Symbiochloris irregularis]|uniref:Amino acid transporter transmembrane domain-containing protein n=1 Tax=Symbiochloris irregularis TaxID=706552 RepID=A0AAW1PFC1_9CHLO
MASDDTAHAGENHKALQFEDPKLSESFSSQSTLAHATAHELCQDSGWEAGFHLATAVDNAFILGYALLVMAFLGWAAGTVLFILGGAVTLYCNIKLANLCVINGKRYTRFRDISEAVFGRPAMWITVICQWINIIAGNIGLTILGGQAFKGMHDLYNDNQNIKLADWMIVTGACNGIFALCIPHLHGLRLWSGIACGCTIVFVVIVVGISAYDGNHFSEQNPGEDRTYAVDGTSTADKAFDAMGALATIAFAYTTVITPEIQATVRDGKHGPAREFYKTLAVAYGIGAPVFLIMSLVGWWAYGDNVGSNLIANLSHPRWAKFIAYLCVLIQTIVSVQVYSSPLYETFDTHFGDIKQKTWSMRNFLNRLWYRPLYIAFTTFIAALLPFFGDFVALMGAITVFPLAFVLTLLMYNKVYRETISPVEKMVNYFGAGLFSIITVATATASLRYIIVDAQNYSVFANLAP